MLARVVLLAATLWLSGCSLLIDVGGNQCKQDADCTKLGLLGPCNAGVCEAAHAITCDAGQCWAVAAQASALPAPCSSNADCAAQPNALCFNAQCAPKQAVDGFVCSDAPPSDHPAFVPFSVHVQEFASQMPPSNLVVTACRLSDLACQTPSATFIDAMHSGDVMLQLPYGFTGYLQLKSPDILPSLWYFTRPLQVETHLRPLRVIAPETRALLATLNGSQVAEDTGMVVIEVFDCSDTPAGGIALQQSKPSGQLFFLVNGVPNTSGTLTVRNAQDNSAIGGFLNVKPGFTIFSARIGANGPLLSEFNANVRADTVTYLDFHP